MKNSLKLVILVVLVILASIFVSATATLNETSFSSILVPLNNSIQIGRITMNANINNSGIRANANNVTQWNYSITRSDTGGIVPSVFCTNITDFGNLTSANQSTIPCTNDTRLFPDAIYNVTIFIANGTNASTVTFATTVIANVSFDNYGPFINFTSPMANSTTLVNANFTNRVFDINFTLIDNLASQNKSYFCELYVAKNFAGQMDINKSTNFVLNKTVIFSNGSNVSFKVPAHNVLLNGSRSTYNVRCRNSAQNETSNFSQALFLTVSDTILPANVTIPVFKNTNNEEKTQFAAGDTVNIKDCSGVDNLDEAGQFNLTIQFPGLNSFSLNNVSLAFSDTSTLGTYSVNCSVSDSSGNINSSTTTFEIIPKVRATNTYAATKAGKATSKGIVGKGNSESVEVGAEAVGRLVSEGGTLKFMINGGEHMVSVKEIGKDSVVLTIRSTPFDLSMTKGDNKDVDVDDDGTADVNIKFNGIFYGKADISLTLLAGASTKKSEKKEEKAPQTPSEKVAEAVRQATGGSGLWLIVIVIVIIIIVGYVLVRRK